NRVLRSIAYVNRLIKNARAQESDRVHGVITADDLAKAETVLIMQVQSAMYSEDLVALRREGRVSKTSVLHQYSPFIDDSGSLRLGGRLQYSDLTEYEKYPIILPAHHLFTQWLIDSIHRNNAHCSV